MKFALLGEDDAALSIVRAIAHDRAHHLTHVVRAGSALSAVLESAPAARVGDDWSELLESDVEAVVLCGSDEDVLYAGRQLAQAGRHVLLFPRAEQGSTLIYELTLIRDASGITLFPALTRRFDPAVSRLKSLIKAGEIGRVRHFEMEGELASADVRTPPSFALRERDSVLLADVDLLRDIGGNYDRVTALLTGRTDDERVSVATVTLSGEELPEAHWQRKAASATSWRMRVTGDNGVLVLRGNGNGLVLENGDGEPVGTAEGPTVVGDAASVAEDAGGILHVATPVDSPFLTDNVPMRETADAGVGRAILDAFMNATRGESASPDWTDLTRVFETVDASHRSIARRRTIDLHFETTSERSLFKTQMTALGCGLLTITLFGVVGLLLVGAALRGDHREQELRQLLDEGWTAAEIAADPEKLPDLSQEEIEREAARIDRVDVLMQIARVVVFAPLFLFIALQLLLFITRPSADESPPRGATS